jgi:hypothetical protein
MRFPSEPTMLYEKKLMEFHVFSTVFSTIRRKKM